MKTPNATEIAVKLAVEKERLRILTVVTRETKTFEEVIKYLETLATTE